MGSTISSPKPWDLGPIASTQRFPTIIHVYYALGRALLRGDPLTRRPPIPVELVLQIFEGINRKNSSIEFTVHSSRGIVFSPISPNTTTLYFHSEPVNRRFLNHVIEMRLNTVSRAFGLWADNLGAETRTWFEIGILRPIGDGAQINNTSTVELNFYNSRTASYASVLKSDGTSDVLRWTSHRNAPASLPYYSLSGEIFGPDHEIWKVLLEGDVIAVYACSTRPLTNMARSGRLMMYEKFDPTALLKGTN